MSADRARALAAFACPGDPDAAEAFTRYLLRGAVK